MRHFGFAARRITGNDVGEILDSCEDARNTIDKPYVMVCDTRLFTGVDCLQKTLPMAHYVAAQTADWQAGIAELDAKLIALDERNC